MADLTTTYMGIELANPIIASSSGITGSVDGVKKCADAGAGAVVLKSLFEEIIIAQNDELERDIIQTGHPEAWDYIQAEVGMQMGTKPYLNFIEEARGAVTVPLIASVNCTTAKWWVSYAKDLESAGASAIELNISHFPQKNGDDTAAIERRYADIAAEVAGRVSVPVAVKIGYHFTALMDVLKAVSGAGAKGIVLFNRGYGVDIDLSARRFVPSMAFTVPQEMTQTLRWVGLAAESLSCDISASTGIHDAEGVLKTLMAGAATVQVCSTLYRNGVGYLAEIVEDLDKWLESNACCSVDDIRGAAIGSSQTDILLHRVQYLKALNEASRYEF